MKKIFLSLLIVLMLTSESYAVASIVKAPGFTKCTVNTAALNMRCGPSSNYKIVKTLKYGTELKAIGKINSWYIVQTSDDTIGMVSGWYISPVDNTSSQNNTSTNNTSNNTTTNVNDLTMTSDEQTIFDLVNETRKNAGLSELKLDKEVLKVARLKSQDMVNNNYFSHTSPTYGTPFQMLKSFGINYKSAGENIAGYATAKAAFEGWMNSSGHKANILGDSYNYTGIGVVSSPRYGLILTQMFIGR
jgi:uncharacterized YkwD family protein